MNVNNQNVRTIRTLFITLCLTLLFQVSHIFAQSLSPEGQWKTISDKTGKVTSIVTITQEGNMLVGKVTKLFRKPEQDPNPLCTKCPDNQKDQPIIGLQILSGLTKDGDEWSGGEILDPDNGKSYSCFIKVEENGKKLHVRGYLGFSLFGRTQIWERESYQRDQNLETKQRL